MESIDSLTDVQQDERDIKLMAQDEIIKKLQKNLQDITNYLTIINNQREPLIFIQVPLTRCELLWPILNQYYRPNERLILQPNIRNKETLLKSLEKEQLSKIKFLRGHISFGLHTIFSYPVMYGTILRNPVERIIALYHFIMNSTHHRLHQELVSNNVSLTEFVSNKNYKELDNHQTKILANVKTNSNNKSLDILQQAKVNLNDIAIIGLTERIPDTLKIIQGMLGYSMNQAGPISASEVISSDVDKSTIRIIERRNQLDIELYSQAQQLFEKRLTNLTQFRILVPNSSKSKAVNINKGHTMEHTIFHITHWKSGSQWIRKILESCVPDLVVPPPPASNDHILKEPINAGKIYLTLYISEQIFNQIALPPKWSRFVIIRDLRDTLVSGYFSLKISHGANNYVDKTRSVLQDLEQEEGFLYLLDNWLGGSARIQKSWLEAGERLIRYEDLLENDVDILESVLLDQCQLPVSREVFREAVIAKRFENLTKGRSRGKEDITKHERKGISGDWRNYFTDKIKTEFKSKYGQLLTQTGYEQDLNW